MTYAVKEVYRSIQGEGHHTGRACVFLRFAGCNAWSGREADRDRDAAKAVCARWCDTDFVGTDGPRGGRYPDARSLAEAIAEEWGPEPLHRIVVLTGGEPSLQLDAALVEQFTLRGFASHVETNGSHLLPAACNWVTLSPKPPLPVVGQRYDEVKVVFDGDVGDPEVWAGYAPLRYLSPLWTPDADELAERMKQCAAYVQERPWWRMTVQLHKVIGVP